MLFASLVWFLCNLTANVRFVDNCKENTLLCFYISFCIQIKQTYITFWQPWFQKKLAQCAACFKKDGHHWKKKTLSANTVCRYIYESKCNSTMWSELKLPFVGQSSFKMGWGEVENSPLVWQVKILILKIMVSSLGLKRRGRFKCQHLWRYDFLGRYYY